LLIRIIGDEAAQNIKLNDVAFPPDALRSRRLPGVAFAFATSVGLTRF
jgi:hypothetical protein